MKPKLNDEQLARIHSHDLRHHEVRASVAAWIAVTLVNTEATEADVHTATLELVKLIAEYVREMDDGLVEKMEAHATAEEA